MIKQSLNGSWEFRQLPSPSFNEALRVSKWQPANIPSELNEGHGVLKCAGAAKLRVGDKIELVPSHVCTTVNLHNSYFAMRGEHLETSWSISGCGMIF